MRCKLICYKHVAFYATYCVPIGYNNYLYATINENAMQKTWYHIISPLILQTEFQIIQTNKWSNY